MFQLSLDGRRLYVTTSLFSTWDNQFYPEIREQGGVMVMIDCDPVNGMSVNPDFIVNFEVSRTGWAVAMRCATPAAIAQAISGYETITIANRGNVVFEVRAKSRSLMSCAMQGWIYPMGANMGCITCAGKLIEGEVDQRAQVALNNRQINDGYVFSALLGEK